MNRFSIIVLLLAGMAFSAVAREGYHITLKVPSIKHTMVYLVHYYGKPMPTIYRRDSAKIDKMLVSDTGLFSGMQERLEPYTKRFGLMTDKQQTLQASLDLVTTKQKRHDYSMDLVYKRYLGQFTQMQVTIAQLESSMSNFG